MMKRFVVIAFILFVMTSCKKDRQDPDPFGRLNIDDLTELTSDIPYAPYAGIHFLNELTGYAAGGNMLVKTTDGGMHWEVKKTWPGLDLLSIQPVGFNTVFILAKDASATYLLKSSDGLATWQQIDLGIAADRYTSGIYFTDQQTGFITGNDLFRKTTNGGLTWTDVLPGVNDRFGGIFFMDNKEGFATASSGRYYTTRDGGAIWMLRSSVTNEDMGKIYASPVSVFAKAGNDHLVDLRTGRISMTVPDIITEFIFLTDKKIIGVGSHYEAGFWPYGDILVTNDGWQSYQARKYTPDIATGFRAVSKAGDHKTIILGFGHLEVPVIAIEY